MENELLSSTSALLSTLSYCLLPPLFSNCVTCCLELTCRPTTEGETQLCLFSIKTSLPVGHFILAHISAYLMYANGCKQISCVHTHAWLMRYPQFDSENFWALKIRTVVFLGSKLCCRFQDCCLKTISGPLPWRLHEIKSPLYSEVFIFDK